MKNKIIFLSMILLLTTTFKSHAGTTEKLTVVLDWFLNPNHASLFVTQQEGFFEEQHLTVKLIGPADPADPVKLVAAGKADIAVSYQPQFVQQTRQGLPLTKIATLIGQPLTCLVVLNKSGINTIAELKGKTIAYGGSADLLILSTMLKYHGLTLRDVKLINVRFNLMQALLSQQVDAAMGMMRNVELTELSLTHHPAHAFFPEDNGVPPYDELILVARTDSKDDSRITRFLKALDRGTQYLIAHPHKCWEQFAKAHPQLNNTLNYKIWFDTVPLFEKPTK